jgi:hypothetical protein
MQGIMADNDVLGQLQIMIRLLHGEAWRDLWLGLNLRVWTFEDLGLKTDAPDADLWHICQDHQIVLITGNRNSEGPDSLEATIKQHNNANSLPVLTLADPKALSQGGIYAGRVVETMLQYLLEIDNVRGTGRLYLP